MENVYNFDGQEFKNYKLLNVPDFVKPSCLHKSHDKTTEEIGNNIIVLDIEATSFFDKDEPRATMYIWMLSVGGDNEKAEYVYGRTWNELSETLNKIAQKWELGKNRQAIIYIHNLAYEFGWFIANPIFHFVSMFLKDKGHPLYAIDKRGFQFRCTYMMTNKALKDFDAPVKKLVGDLDYELMRHSKTEMTEKEMHYCFRDIYIPRFYLNKLRDEYGDLFKIPFTKTGFVRERVRRACFSFSKYFNLKIKKMQPDLEMYELLKKAYQGGYTHANYNYVDEIQENLTCIDFTSSYPASMLCKMPMGSWWKMTNPNLTKVKREIRAKKYAMVITFIAKNVIAKKEWTIISVNKADEVMRKNIRIDNGRVWKADLLKMTVTDLDFASILAYYDIEEMEIVDVRCCKYGYLPQPIIECMLEYYGAKTTLKGVAGKENEYMRGKEDVNCLYGMCVSDIVHTLVEWSKADDDYIERMETSAVEQLEDYKNNWSTFLVYSWGVWISARSRFNLLKVLYEIDKDAVYCDTDSIKFKNGDKYKQLIKDYNNDIIKEESECLAFYNIEIDKLKPKTKDGVEKPLGVFDYEKPYKRFVTQGAKKYAYEYENGEFGITLAGCSKKGANFINAIWYRSHKRIDRLDMFRAGFVWSEEYSGRTTATHRYKTSDHFKTTLTDYMGVKAEVEEWSYINITPTTYELDNKKIKEFQNFLLGKFQERCDGSYLRREKDYVR